MPILRSPRFLTGLFSRPARRTPSRRLLRLEVLEDRTVPSTIQGTVFQDPNSNGVRDAGEAALAGWTVFMDVNRNSVLDPGEVSAVTDAAGHYLLDTTNVPPSQSNGTTLRDFVALSLETGTGGRWLNTTPTYAVVDRNLQPDATRDFGAAFQPFAGVAPVGPETLVNATVAGQQGGVVGSQGEPVSVASDAAGDYVVAWRTFVANAPDTISARVFNAAGTPRTGELLVGTGEAASGTQYAVMPRVAMSADGTRFAVAWSDDQSTSIHSTLMRLYQGDGTPVTGPVTVVLGTSKVSASVEGLAMDGVGNFAVQYGQSTYSNSSGWSNDAVKVQRYTRAGAANGAAIAVVTPSLIGGQKGLAMDSAGDFVVVWDDAPASQAGTTNVNAQRYDSAGRKAGSAIMVASLSGSQTDLVSKSSVAMAADGRFVVAWEHRVGRLTPAGARYYDFIGNAQTYGATGVATGSVMEVNRSNTTEQPLGVSYDQAGNVAFAYTDVRTPTLGVNYPSGASEVRFRRLTAAGQLEPESMANTTTQGAQFRPGVAATANGGFVVAWQGYGPGDDAGIFAQRFAPASPLVAAAPAPSGAAGAPLTAAALAPLADEAIRRWAATGLTVAQLDLLRSIDFRVADLAGDELGLTASHTVWLDADAAGWGWFIDPTPWDDSEFTTAGDQGELHHMDLLTVLMHEMGHVLGYDHDAGSVMAASLAAGTRESATDGLLSNK